MTDRFPADVEAAAIAAWDVLDNSCTETWEPIARAILAERERPAKIIYDLLEKLYGEPGLQASHERGALTRVLYAIRKETP